jgi:hypothetical protein
MIEFGWQAIPAGANFLQIIAAARFLQRILDHLHEGRVRFRHQDPYLPVHKNIPYRPLTDDRCWQIDPTPDCPFLTVGGLRSAVIMYFY